MLNLHLKLLPRKFSGIGHRRHYVWEMGSVSLAALPMTYESSNIDVNIAICIRQRPHLDGKSTQPQEVGKIERK